MEGGREGWREGGREGGVVMTHTSCSTGAVMGNSGDVVDGQLAVCSSIRQQWATRCTQHVLF